MRCLSQAFSLLGCWLSAIGYGLASVGLLLATPPHGKEDRELSV